MKALAEEFRIINRRSPPRTLLQQTDIGSERGFIADAESCF
jgi:hypothetical protein